MEFFREIFFQFLLLSGKKPIDGRIENESAQKYEKIFVITIFGL